MADCSARTSGYGHCFRKKGHGGDHLSFPDTGPGLRRAVSWSVDEVVTPVPVHAVEQRNQHEDAQNRPHEHLSTGRNGRHDEAGDDEVSGGQHQNDDQKADDPTEIHGSPIAVA